MYNKYFRFCCLLLSLVLLVNMVPAQALAAELLGQGDGSVVPLLPLKTQHRQGAPACAGASVV